MTYDWRSDAFDCYALWAAIHRERGVREGRFAPASTQEMIQAAEGPCPDIDLDCTQNLPGGADAGS